MIIVITNNKTTRMWSFFLLEVLFLENCFIFYFNFVVFLWENVTEILWGKLIQNKSNSEKRQIKFKKVHFLIGCAVLRIFHWISLVDNVSLILIQFLMLFLLNNISENYEVWNEFNYLYLHAQRQYMIQFNVCNCFHNCSNMVLTHFQTEWRQYSVTHYILWVVNSFY